MLLSVVIPVYNNPADLGRCLSSLLVPQVCDWVQCVVINDGSDELCEEEFRKVVSPYGPNVVYSRQSHGGAASARNNGIDLACGRFVWFVDADDKVCIPQYERLLILLDSLPDDINLFHTGPMLHQSEKDCSCSETNYSIVTPADILAPKTACLDHTTYLVSRDLLTGNPELRYPDAHRLLEDSVFVLRLLEVSSAIAVNTDCRPYVRCGDNHSLTSGPWDRPKCEAFMPDIYSFFDSLVDFESRNHDFPHLHDLCRRYCYLYVRVLAVKGCPWSLLLPFRNRLIYVGYVPSTVKEKMVFCKPLLFLLSNLCRLLR